MRISNGSSGAQIDASAGSGFGDVRRRQRAHDVPSGEHQFAHALAGRRRDAAQAGDLRRKRLEARARVGQIEFGDDRDRRLVRQRRIPRRAARSRSWLYRRAVRRAASRRPSDGSARACVRRGARSDRRGPAPSLAPSIKPGHVDQHERRFVVDAHDAELRFERGERVVGDLRPGGRDDREQRRFAGVRQSDQAGSRPAA